MTINFYSHRTWYPHKLANTGTKFYLTFCPFITSETGLGDLIKAFPVLVCFLFKILLSVQDNLTEKSLF